MIPEVDENGLITKKYRDFLESQLPPSAVMSEIYLLWFTAQRWADIAAVEAVPVPQGFLGPLFTNGADFMKKAILTALKAGPVSAPAEAGVAEMMESMNIQPSSPTASSGTGARVIEDDDGEPG